MSSIFNGGGRKQHNANKTNGKHHDDDKTSTFKPNRPNGDTNESGEDETAPQKPKLAFHCQQAQGSPTGIISGFTNVKELYKKIAECYDMEPSEVGVDDVVTNCVICF